MSDYVEPSHVRRRRLQLIAVVVFGVASIIVIWSVATRAAGQPAEIRYEDGRATVTADGNAPAQFALVGQGAQMPEPVGVALAFAPDETWSLSLNGPADQLKGTLQHDAADFRGWAGFDSKTCAVALDDATAIRITGTIRCRGLIWYDKSDVEHVQPLARPPFDMDVTFEASGPGTLPTSTTSPS